MFNITKTSDTHNFGYYIEKNKLLDTTLTRRSKKLHD